MYGSLIREYGPANVSTDMSWPEAMAVFTQGQAGFYVEANSLYKNATDPTKSQVADTVGFAAFPAGPAGSRPYNIPSWALGVNAGSTNIDNAWKFIEWATSKEQTLLNQQVGVPSARTSVWADPQATQDYPPDCWPPRKLPPTTVSVMIVRWSSRWRRLEIVGQPIVDSITGKDLDASLAGASDLLPGVPRRREVAGPIGPPEPWCCRPARAGQYSIGDARDCSCISDLSPSYSLRRHMSAPIDNPASGQAVAVDQPSRPQPLKHLLALGQSAPQVAIRSSRDGIHGSNAHLSARLDDLPEPHECSGLRASTQVLHRLRQLHRCTHRHRALLAGRRAHPGVHRGSADCPDGSWACASRCCSADRSVARASSGWRFCCPWSPRR